MTMSLSLSDSYVNECLTSKGWKQPSEEGPAGALDRGLGRWSGPVSEREARLSIDYMQWFIFYLMVVL